ncbi:MAG: metallophosphoesterase [Clostridia bacterium]|nr:metallophosphoesterase [Clostridia bacterium]
MKYYVVADPHGFYSELVSALDEKGYFDDHTPHKLIICGDLLDRGSEALKMQKFVFDLLAKDEVILIRGNHEDLMLSLIDDWDDHSFERRHHLHNGTVDTVLQMSGESSVTPENGDRILKIARSSAFVNQIIPQTIDYFETERYIFVHGWIPCVRTQLTYSTYFNKKIEDWRNAGREDWTEARWINGMDAWMQGVRERDKTIVCGHFHCSYGHANIEHRGSEFGEDADFSPFVADGILAIDACTAVSGKVNCVVIED